MIVIVKLTRYDWQHVLVHVGHDVLSVDRMKVVHLLQFGVSGHVDLLALGLVFYGHAREAHLSNFTVDVRLRMLRIHCTHMDTVAGASQ